MPEIRGEIGGDASGFVSAVDRSMSELNKLQSTGKKTSGSLADGFKKVRGAANELGGHLATLGKVALTAGAAMAGLATAAGVVAVKAAREQIRVENQLEAVLRSTGQAAGLTKDELLAMAAGFQQVTNFGDETVINAQNVLLTFTKIGKETFPQALGVILDMSAALGQDLKQSAIQVGKALNDPAKGVSALAEVGVAFSKDQVEVIKKLTETGDVAEAQALILKELATEFGGSAQAQADSMTQLTNAAGDVAEEIGRALIPIIDQAAQDILAMVPTIQAWAKSFAESVREFSEGGGIIERSLRAVADAINFVKDPIAGIVTGFKILKNIFEIVVNGGLFVASTMASMGLEILRAAEVVLKFGSAAASVFGKEELAADLKGMEKGVREFREETQAMADALSEEFANSTKKAAKELANYQDTYISVRNVLDGAEQATRNAAEAVEEQRGKTVETNAAVKDYTKFVNEAANAARNKAAATEKDTEAVKKNTAALAANAGRRFARFSGDEGGGRATGGSVIVGGAAASGGGTVTGPFVITGAGIRSVSDSGAIEGFQLGGRVRSSGLHQLEQGEVVLNRSAVAALGAPLLDAINRVSPSVNVGGITINAGGGDGSPRSIARAIVPELERALARGIREASLA